MPSNKKKPDTAATPVSATLTALEVNPETGLTRAEVDARRKEHSYNEVAEQKTHSVRKFLGKFWCVSAWMLEMIIVLSANRCHSIATSPGTPFCWPRCARPVILSRDSENSRELPAGLPAILPEGKPIRQVSAKFQAGGSLSLV